MAQVSQKKMDVIRYDNGIPVIRVERDPDWNIERVKRVRFWCMYCEDYHTHGAYPDGRKNQGHRSAHCFTDHSPFNMGGYFMELSDPAEQS